MEKFLVKIVFRVCVNDQHDHFDEQLHLFEAITKAGALQKAQFFGVQESGVFNNASGDCVSWQFIGVSELVWLPARAEKSLVFSFSNKESDHAGYTQFLEQRAKAVQEKEPAFS